MLERIAAWLADDAKFARRVERAYRSVFLDSATLPGGEFAGE